MADGSAQPDISEDKLVRRGGQGAVYKSTFRGKPVAVKVIPSDKTSTIDAELAALRRLNGRHPHIVFAMKSIVTPEGDVQLILELADCDLFDEMQRQDSSYFTENHQFREWMLQCAHALSYAHRKGVCHRDVKPENFVLMQYKKRKSREGGAGRPTPGGSASEGKTDAGPKRIIAKIIDFGSALITDAGGPAKGRSACGSTRYACPRICRLHMARSQAEAAANIWGYPLDYDLLRHQGYDARAADVWSFAVMVYVLASGVCPFRTACIGDGRFRSYVATEQRHCLDDVICAPSSAEWSKGGGRVPRWHWPAHFSPALVDLLRCCMQVRAVERITMADVIKHPWFTRPGWSPPPGDVASIHLASAADMSYAAWAEAQVAASKAGARGETSAQRASLPASPTVPGASEGKTAEGWGAHPDQSASGGVRAGGGGRGPPGAEGKEDDGEGKEGGEDPVGGGAPPTAKGAFNPSGSHSTDTGGGLSIVSGANTASGSPTAAQAAAGGGSGHAVPSPTSMYGSGAASVAGRTMAMSVASHASAPSQVDSSGISSQHSGAATTASPRHLGSATVEVGMYDSVGLSSSGRGPSSPPSLTTAHSSGGASTATPVVRGGGRVSELQRQGHSPMVPPGS